MRVHSDDLVTRAPAPTPAAELTGALTRERIAAITWRGQVDFIPDGGGLYLQVGETFKRWVFRAAEGAPATPLGVVQRHDLAQARAWAQALRERAAAGLLEAGQAQHRERRSRNAVAANTARWSREGAR